MVPLRMCLNGRTRIQLGFPVFFTAFISEANFSGKLEQSELFEQQRHTARIYT